MEAEITVYLFKAKWEGENTDCWHFGVSTQTDIPNKKYVAFCEQLRNACEILND